MVKQGYVYSNLMVNMHLTNEKLVERGILIIETLAHVSRETALETLERADMSVPLALVMLIGDVSKSVSVKRLRKAKGNVRKAIEG
jgi:N-acetylmuramic acid 6-phosphate etherase